MDAGFVPETPYESAPQVLEIPALLPEETAGKIRRMAVRAFEAVEAAAPRRPTFS